MLRPKEKEWAIVNTVFVKGEGVDEKYGYLIRNKDLEQRIVKANTTDRLKEQGRLEVSYAQELSYISVPREYVEQIQGLNI